MRRVPGQGAFLFVAGRLGRPAPVEIQLHDLDALGLSAEGTVTATELLTENSLGHLDLGKRELNLELEAYGTAVIRLEQ